MQTDTRRFIACLLALLTLTAIAYWPGLTGGFLFDDYPNIVQQPRVHLTELSLQTLTQAWQAFSLGPFGRPLAMVTFAIDHYFWGLDPYGYKLSSLLVHLMNAVLVFLLMRGLGGPRREDAMPLVAAFAIALLWAVHPLQVSTVLYVVQRMEMLSLAFVLMALICYIRGRQAQMAGGRGWPWLAATLPFVALGLLCKESAALFPAYSLALELAWLRFASATPATTRWLKLAYASMSLVGLAIFLFAVVPVYAGPDEYALRSFTAGERLLTQLRVLPLYLWWTILPQPASYQFYFDDYQASTGLLSPVTTLVGGLVLAGLAAAAIALRRSVPLFTLGMAWFFASHLLTSNVLALELVFEHRNYFSILGVLLALYGLVGKLPASEIPRVRTLALSVIVIGYLSLTLIRSAGWGNATQLALELAERNPTSTRASTDLGEQYMLRAGKDPQSPFYAQAIAEFERGARIPGASPMPEQGLIIMAVSSGQPDRDEWWDSLISKFEERTIGPQEVSMITNLLAMREKGLEFNDEKFADAYLVLVRKVGLPPSQYYAMGRHALRHLGDEALAGKLFAIAVDRSLQDPAFIVRMVEALYKDGHVEIARELADHALKVARVRIDFPNVPPPANKAPAAGEATPIEGSSIAP